MNKENGTIQQLALDLESHMNNITVITDRIEHAQNVLSGVAQDAEEKYELNRPEFFLHDNNDQLQIVEGYLARLVKELRSTLEATHETRAQLSKELKTAIL